MKWSRRRFVMGCVCVLSGSFTGCIQEFNSYRFGSRDLFFDNGFLNVAHQGGDLIKPGNTMVAFRHAVELGVDVLEMDLQMSADDEIVLLHDETVDRTTDGEGFVGDYTVEELKELDAAYNWSNDGGETYPYRGRGVEIPTLEEVLDEFPDKWYLFEPKKNEVSIAVLVDLLETMGVDDQVMIGGFDDSIVRGVRRSRPDIPTGLGVRESMEFLFISRGDEIGFVPPGEILFPPSDLVSPELVERAGRLDMRVIPWTVNSRVEMERLIDIGVDGIITDDPVTLADLLASRGLTP